MMNDEFLGENCSFYHIDHIIIYKKQKARLEMNGFSVLSKGVNHVSYFKSYVTTLCYLRAIFTYSN